MGSGVILSLLFIFVRLFVSLLNINLFSGSAPAKMAWEASSNNLLTLNNAKVHSKSKILFILQFLCFNALFNITVD